MGIQRLMNATLLWFRNDLRLDDNPALRAAALRGGPVIPVYIWAPDEESPWAPGAASRWWLHGSLAALDESLRRRGSRLVIRAGETLTTLRALARESGANAIVWNRRYEPACIERDKRVKQALAAEGLETRSSNAGLLREPWEITTQAGGPFQVFTPFWRACLSKGAFDEPAPSPARWTSPSRWPASLRVDELGLLPAVDWAGGLRAEWTPGEEGAQQRLQRFVAKDLGGYPHERDRPDHRGVSRLSPHLHFGEVGPRQVAAAVRDRSAADEETGAGATAYLRELGWREFAHHLLFHFPLTPEQPLRPAFARFPWARAPEALRAWQRGRTGYPIVDAGLRELWTTGFMHNRVRMIVASFLVKDLLVPWQEGARWFWDTLVDADLANNTLGWQWSAGCGADAAPFFRIFNPVTQGERFDPEGVYVKRWLPELAGVPAAAVHKASAPLVDHAWARERALAAFRQVR